MRQRPYEILSSEFHYEQILRNSILRWGYNFRIMLKLKKYAIFAVVVIGLVTAIKFAACHVSQSASAPTSITGDNHSKSTSSDPPCWHKLVAWPEGITAWLLLGTLGAIVWQAWETRRSAEASALAAKVAKDGLIAVQRPKVFVKWVFLIPGKPKDVGGTQILEDDHHWRIGCVVANLGGSKAEIIESNLTIEARGIGSIDDLLPNLPPYGTDYSFEQFSIDPGERQEKVIVLARQPETARFKFLWEQCMAGNHTDTSPLICFGFFSYRDLSGVDRRTGFGARLNPEDMSFTRLTDKPEYEYCD